MSHMLPLLTQMRGRLGMYVGTPSLTRLAAFLRGYDYGVEQAGGQPDPFLGFFRDWIHERFRTTAYSWEDVILHNSKDETDALERFWALLEEYLQERDGTVEALAGAAGSQRTITSRRQCQ